MIGWLEGRADTGIGLERVTGKPATRAMQKSNFESLLISHVERQSTLTVLVSWSDPTRGQYKDQTWRAVVARRAGYCCLTGASVRRGDLVFRPLVRGGVLPSNASDMILAASLPPEWEDCAA
jgi:hypothetical protein